MIQGGLVVRCPLGANAATSLASPVPGATGRPGPAGGHSGDSAWTRAGSASAAVLKPGPLSALAGGCQAACSAAESRGGSWSRARTRLSLARPPGCNQPKRRTRWKPRGQDVLEEAAEELEGFEVDVLPGAGAAVAEGPAQPSIGQELEWAIAGGGFEHVAAEVAQSVLAAAGGGAVNDPALLPHFGREVGQRLGHLLLEGLAEERAAAITQGFDRQEEAGAAGDPLALVRAQAATGDQVMHVGMIFQRARPGVQHAQQAEGGAEAFGVLRQVLQGLGTGGQEQIVAEAGMRANPAAQALRAR